MNRESLRKIIEACNQENRGSGYIPFKLAEELSEQQKQAAINSYAKGVNPEEIAAQLSTGLSDSGEKGVLLTETYMYASGMTRGPIALDELQSAVCQTEKNSLFKNAETRVVILIFKDGTVYDFGLEAAVEMRLALPFLQKLTGSETAERMPVIKGEEFYRQYHAALQKNIESIAEKYSSADTRIRFAKSEAPEVLDNLIAGCEADVKPEDILAVHNIVAQTGRTGAFFTDRAYYSCYFGKKNITAIRYDGLKRIVPAVNPLGRHEEMLLFYENGYVYRWVVGREEIKQDREILREILEVFQNIETLTSEEKKLLSIEEGWKEFTDKRGKSALESYKNSVFVSSTFKDMHYERDIIHEKVLPVLNRTGLEYGQTISFCDLRWGVNTGELDSEEGSKKVLSVCLHEIERCKPYMIVILGERYGWIPEKKMIENALEGYPDFALDELEKSVTALEIEFGALADTRQLDRTFFYFRNIEGNPPDSYKKEDAHHAEKLSALKARIQRLAGKQLKYYTVVWDEKNNCPSELDTFAGMVARDVKGAMEQEWRRQAGKSAFQRELDMHWEQAEKKALQCSGRDELLLSYLREMEQGEKMLVLTGEAGSGKSTVMGALAVTLRMSGADVLPVFCGYTAQSDTAIEVVQHIVYFLRQCLGIEAEQGEIPQTEKEWLEQMEMLTERYAAESGRCAVFVIDAADQLMAGELRDSLRFLPESASERIRVILSCLDDFPLPYVSNKKVLPLMRQEDKPEVIRGILRLHRRELENAVIEAIAAKASSDHPLYMSLLIQRMLMMNKNDFDDIAGQGDGMSAITSHQLELVRKSADELRGICREILHAAASRIGGGFVEKAMECLALSRHGLRESDLEDILTGEGILWNALDFSLFINYLRSMFLIRDDGRIDFSHKSFREGFEQENEKDIHEKLWMRLAKLPEHDEVRRQEVVYHEIRAGKKAEFVEDIHAHREDGAFLKKAAKEIVLYSRTDDGKWLMESFRELTEESTGRDYMAFLAGPVYQELGAEDRKALWERIYSAALPVAEKLAASHNHAEDRRHVSQINRYLGMICEDFGTQEDYGKALPYYEKALAIDAALEKEKNTPAEKMNLAADYSLLGRLYLKMDEHGNRDRAVQCYEDSISIAEAAVKEAPEAENLKNLGEFYRRMAKLYEEEKDREKELNYLDKCIAVREQTVEKNPTVGNRKELCYTYHRAGFCHLSQGTPEEKEAALHLSEKESALWEKIVTEDRRISNLKWLGTTYYNMGMVYYDYASGDEHYREPSVDYFRKSMPLMEEVYKADKTERKTARKSLAGIYRYASELLRKSDTASATAQAKEWAERSLALYQEIAEETQTVKAYEDVSTMLFSCHEFIPRTGKGIAYLEQDIKINEMLYEKTRDKKYKTYIKAAKFNLKLERTVVKVSKAAKA